VMTPIEKYTALKCLERAWDEVNRLQTDTPCTDCINWDFPKICKLYPREAIPNDIMGKGCGSWVFDEKSIPF
jgi:hypothetical protein